MSCPSVAGASFPPHPTTSTLRLSLAYRTRNRAKLDRTFQWTGFKRSDFRPGRRFDRCAASGESPASSARRRAGRVKAKSGLGSTRWQWQRGGPLRCSLSGFTTNPTVQPVNIMSWLSRPVNGFPAPSLFPRAIPLAKYSHSQPASRANDLVISQVALNRTSPAGAHFH